MSDESAASPPAARPKKRRPWHYYNILLHRYLGYFFLGTTVIYAISGLAVNHMEDWNPNYIVERQQVDVAPLADDEDLSESEALQIFQSLGLKQGQSFNPNNVFYPDENLVEILLSSNEKIRINTSTWRAEHEQVKRRPFLHLFNFLHLNSAKKAWTLYADLYAIALLLIALTGLFMKKGRKGLWGEAGLWIAAGLALPFVLVWIYYPGS